MKIRPDILYADEHQLIVHKPTGMLSIPDRHVPEKLNLLDWLQQKYGQVLTVHRLDKDTSGVICFARHAEAHRHLSLQFEHNQVQKYYLALLDGQLHQAEGIIDQPIAPHPTRPGRMVVNKHGKEALTHFRRLESFQRFTLVEAEIKTGRTHQIRVHFQSLGFPLAVDEFYGPRPALYLSEIKGRAYRQGKDQDERPLLDRLSLHARQLSLTLFGKEHPESFEAPLPKDLSVALKQLRKWNS
ncbi:MAG: RluA family pseudouridine synthase [Saprospiraceae bacterium]|nr:RluA family pseudouridine synthase [Lewinella sp.]